MKIYPLIVIFFLFSLEGINAQDFFRKLDEDKINILQNEGYYEKNLPSKYVLMSFEIDRFKNTIGLQSNLKKRLIKIPNATGSYSRFLLEESSNFETKLAQKFSMIKSYSAQGIDDPTSVAKISIGSDGFHAIVFSGNEETLYIDPYSKDSKTLIVYKKSHIVKDKDDFTCEVEGLSHKKIGQKNTSQNTNDGKLRIFRLALACTGEYAQFHLANQNVSATATEEGKKAAILSAMNTTITRVNGVFERDLAVKMVLVEENDKIIFLDASTDGFSNDNADDLIDESQTICDTTIGSNNYDIGHTFSTEGGGLAGLGVVCVDGQKAKGITGSSSPIGDSYDIDYVAHEMGHQFGANHTQNNDCNRNLSTAVEPGSGSTIMGYAGICSPNVQNKSDAYFHAVSIAEMWSTIQSSATCASISAIDNALPTADAGADFSIPKATPFVLKGEATDADGTASLTYNWEQIDNEIALTMPPEASSTRGPMFRSLPSKASPIRYMPALETVVAGSNFSTWEVLPDVVRELNFSFFVRDDYYGGGGTARDNMRVSVENSEAFRVTAANSAVIWDTGTTQTITWNKGTTDVAPINCQNVNIKLSIDGGTTFPIILKANTPNDGSESVVIPDTPSTTSRIMVEAADNIFYNINATNFTINSSAPSFIITNLSGEQSACNSGNESVSYVLNFDFINGFTESVSLSASGFPEGASVTFNPSTISDDGNVTMTISNFSEASAQMYTVNIAGSSSENKNIDLPFKLFSQITDARMLLISPINNATGISLSEVLRWDSIINASSYDVEIASDQEFTTIVSSGNVPTNSYTATSLEANTTYYWRVKSKNPCGDGAYSVTFSFTTLTPDYCVSTFTDEADHITNVTFNTINNDSGNDLIDGYEDYTSILTNLKRGGTHQMSVTFDTDGYQDNCTVFIDWNQDYVFDVATERYDLGIGYDNLSTKTLAITVPETAQLGATRMRVLVEYTGNSSPHGEGACDADHNSEYGETEDYTLIIEDSTASVEDQSLGNFKLYPNPTKGVFTLALNLVRSDKILVQLFDLRGRLLDEKKYIPRSSNFSEKIYFEEASAGLYFLKVISGDTQVMRKLMIK